MRGKEKTEKEREKNTSGRISGNEKAGNLGSRVFLQCSKEKQCENVTSVFCEVTSKPRLLVRSVDSILRFYFRDM